MDHVKTALLANRVANHFRVHVKRIGERARERFGVFHSQIRDQVCVHRRARHTVNRAGK